MVALLMLLLASPAWTDAIAERTSSGDSHNMDLGGCNNGITCRNITANNLTFQCREATPAEGLVMNGSVMLLHGFPEWSDMFLDVSDRCSLLQMFARISATLL